MVCFFTNEKNKLYINLALEKWQNVKLEKGILIINNYIKIPTSKILEIKIKSEFNYDESKLYKDIGNVFKNEDYIDILDYTPHENEASIDLYDIGYLGENVFFTKIEKRYAKKFKKLGYKINISKFYDEGNGAEARIRFYF